MGIRKVPGEYVEAMTEPGGWPSIDEDHLYRRAKELLHVRNQVHGVVARWHQQQGQVFEGGIWTGGGANAGNSSVQQRINEMSLLEGHLSKGYAYYSMAADLIGQSKALINRNLINAQKAVQSLRVLR